MRRFEFVQGSSAKFWMAEVRGNTFLVVYGRLGTEGQRKEKAFPDAKGAQREYERKVAEKLREGYQEVSTQEVSTQAPPPAPRPSLPTRVRAGRPSTAQVALALEALSALEAQVGGRSWRLALQARRARRALRALGGFEPASHPALGPLFTALMEKVVAPRTSPRLPLWVAMGLLAELDVAAFLRTLEQWKRAPAGAPARVATEVLVRQAEALGEPELALRLGALLAERPGGPLQGWEKRWSVLRPHVEGQLVSAGSSLPAWLRGLDAGGEPHLAARLARLAA